MHIEFIENLVIEITRKCNMSCSHCLRGEAQGINISVDTIIEFAKQFEGCQIGFLTLSGGEPSLVPHIIGKIIEVFKAYDVTIQNFYMATNGKQISDEFVNMCAKLYNYCTDNDISSVELSNDLRHAEDGEQGDFSKLECFTFAGKRNKKGGDMYITLDQGRNEGIGKRTVREEEFKLEDDSLLEGNLYLNVLGQLVDGCNRSYENQQKHVICTTKDDFLTKIVEYVENQK